MTLLDEPYVRFTSAQRGLLRALNTIDVIATVESQQLALRGFAVQICAEFEALIKAIAQAHVDATTEAWDNMLPAQRMFVAAQIAAEMEPAVRGGYEAVESPKSAARIAKQVMRSSRWLTTAGEFARDGVPRIGDFYDATNVAKAVESVLSLTRPDGVRFFDWLGSYGADQSSYKLSLDALVTLRNDVAHQLGQGLKTTPEELRNHQKRLAVLARGMRAYTRGVELGPGTGWVP